MVHTHTHVRTHINTQTRTSQTQTHNYSETKEGALNYFKLRNGNFCQELIFRFYSIPIDQTLKRWWSTSAVAGSSSPHLQDLTFHLESNHGKDDTVGGRRKEVNKGLIKLPPQSSRCRLNALVGYGSKVPGVSHKALRPRCLPLSLCF